jgi:hypothetical protein
LGFPEPCHYNFAGFTIRIGIMPLLFHLYRAPAVFYTRHDLGPTCKPVYSYTNFVWTILPLPL